MQLVRPRRLLADLGGKAGMYVDLALVLQHPEEPVQLLIVQCHA
jgi:hypothetical protein